MGKVLILTGLLVVIAIGAFFITKLTSPASQPPTYNSQPTTTSTPATNISDQNSLAELRADERPRYLGYSPEVFSAHADKRRVLYFYANWCPTCRPADQEFQANSSQIPPDVVLIRVNYNDSDTDQLEKDLARKYAVTYQHTFVQVDAQGNAIAKWNGGSLTELLQNLK